MMSPGSAPSRASQKSALAGILHEKKTNPHLGTLITALATNKEALASLPSDYDRANVRIAKRDWDLQTRKTKAMASREAELEAKGYNTWVSAREKNDFPAFAPVLEEIVQMKKEVAAATHPGKNSYDANIDTFEPNMPSERLAEIFADLKKDLVPLLNEILASEVYKKSKATGPKPPLKGGKDWDVTSQAKLSREISEALGFDYQNGNYLPIRVCVCVCLCLSPIHPSTHPQNIHTKNHITHTHSHTHNTHTHTIQNHTGRIDTSVHPFTGGSHPTDVRITTRYSEDKWMEGISGTVHEVGHGLYEQARNPEQRDLPVSRALSMGVHESQSLIWERMVFQSRAFWQWATPKFHEFFPHTKVVY
jgi:carboxypeptidase Taq